MMIVCMCVIGRGKFVSAETKVVYEGAWERGVKHGLGMMVFPSGDRLQGTWRAGLLDGPCMYYFAESSPWLDPEY